MRRMHVILAISLVLGILLQGLFLLMSFQWATFLFILLNLSLPFWAIHKLQGEAPEPMPFGPLSLRVFVEIGLLIACTYPVVQIIGDAASLFVGNPLNQGEIETGTLFGLSVILLAPLIEEVFFRGYLRSSYEVHGIRHAAFWGALWFALYHLNIHQGIYTFFLALVLSGAMNRYENIAVPVLIHSGINGLSYLAQSGNPGAMISMYYSLMDPVYWTFGLKAIYLVGFFSCIYLLFYKPYQTRRASMKVPFKMDRATWIIVIIFIWASITTYLN